MVLSILLHDFLFVRINAFINNIIRSKVGREREDLSPSNRGFSPVVNLQFT